MDEKKMNQLAAANIDVQEALERFMGNEGLLMKFLLRFPQDESFQQLKQAMEAKDTDQAYRAAHALKGLAGNLAMKSLYEQVCSVMADLREGDLSTAQGKMAELESQYQGVLDALQSIQ